MAVAGKSRIKQERKNITVSVGIRHRLKEGRDYNTRKYSKNQEKAVAEALGGRRTPNSGAGDWQKSDVFTDDGNWAIECKTKMAPSESMSIKKAWLEKNKEEAMFMCKPYCALAFNFGPDEENYYIIDQYLFQDLMEYLRGKKDR